ncbi:MAG: amino acid permease, partial [Ensifer adhaerens]|nr:amino acid permease [Ensifer adhaerens]
MAARPSLGIWACSALVVGNIIGSGFYLSPAALAPYGAAALVGWVGMAVAAMCLGLVFARLAGVRPATGGPYAYSSLTADYRAGTTQVFGELGYGLQASGLSFEPFANIAYVNVHTDGFTEKGAAAALSVRGGSDDMTFTTFGLRLATEFDLGTAKATARGLIGWRHAYGDVTPAVVQ